uniref:O-methyltransferase C-terminal domain-containing protein n=1 Tax=Aegilops tauschii subsp. strangulata TaxID=200361 RepID=A0A453MXW6_AEGTS
RRVAPSSSTAHRRRPPPSPPRPPQPTTSPPTAAPSHPSPRIIREEKWQIERPDPPTSGPVATADDRSEGGRHQRAALGRGAAPAGPPGPVLRLLASAGVFSEHTADGGRRRYALGLAWPRLREAVLEPFARAHAGVPAYAYYGLDREANDVMLRAMTGVSEPFMEVLLDGYCPGGWFEGVATLVNVGGSSGACLGIIMRRVPTIRQGVNFDLPDFVAAAPPISEGAGTWPGEHGTALSKWQAEVQHSCTDSNTRST